MQTHRTRLSPAFLAASSVALMLLVAACSENTVAPPSDGGTTAPPPSGEVSFRTHVVPIFNGHGCTGCHGGTSGLSVGTVSELLAGGDHGPAITPGNANASILIQKLSTTPPFGSRMPLGGPYLADTTIGIIKRWINEGAKDN